MGSSSVAVAVRPALIPMTRSRNCSRQCLSALSTVPTTARFSAPKSWAPRSPRQLATDTPSNWRSGTTCTGNCWASRSSARSPGTVQCRTRPGFVATTRSELLGGECGQPGRSRQGLVEPPTPARRSHLRLAPFRMHNCRWSRSVTVSVGQYLLHLRDCKERPHV